jgi:hypothetical protein
MPYPYNIVHHIKLAKLIDLRDRLLEEAEHFSHKKDVRDRKLYRAMEIDSEIVRRDWPRYEDDESLYTKEIKDLYSFLIGTL